MIGKILVLHNHILRKEDWNDREQTNQQQRRVRIGKSANFDAIVGNVNEKGIRNLRHVRAR